MSQGLFLVCHATRSEVHVQESGGFGVRGADDDLVVAAFCDAHAFRHQLVVLGEERDNPEHEGYTLWTASNLEEQYRLVAPEGAQFFLAKFVGAIKARRDEYERERTGAN